MKEQKVLYLSYNSLLSHLGRSQILPYLKILSDKGYRFFVISFEEPRNLPRETIDKSFFHWYRLTRWKKTRGISLVRNIAVGTALAFYLVHKHRIRMIHARSYLPGVMALLLKILIPGRKVLFDMRGFMLDEYLEGGVLSPRSPLARIGRFFEKKIFRAADGIVTLTRKSLPVLRRPEWIGDRKMPVTVIPCCAELNQTVIRENVKEGVGEGAEGPGKIRLIYAGSLGSWYDLPGTLSFFEALNKKYPLSTLTILSPQSESAKEIVDRHYLKERISLASVPFSEVRRYLAEADIGLIIYQSGFSRIGTSPIKFPEYLWAGLVTVASPGVGDLDELIPKYQVGVILDSSDERAVDRSIELLADRGRKERCRRVAERFYNLEEGAKLYETAYETLGAQKRC